MYVVAEAAFETDFGHSIEIQAHFLPSGPQPALQASRRVKRLQDKEEKPDNPEIQYLHQNPKRLYPPKIHT